MYAIGDIHGRYDLLQRLYAQIQGELDASPPQQSIEVFLGDYIDRGPQSRDVLNFLIGSEPACDERVCLMGNHEDLLLQALEHPSEMEGWLRNGGRETLLSYGVAASMFGGLQLEFVRAAALLAVPQQHRQFLAALRRAAVIGGYIFVHAGLRPGRSVAEQDPEDLIWIREPFLSSRADFGGIVVHGHTPAAEPEHLPNRINVDTGAFFSGRLTCVVLEGDSQRFVQVSAD